MALIESVIQVVAISRTTTLAAAGTNPAIRTATKAKSANYTTTLIMSRALKIATASTAGKSRSIPGSPSSLIGAKGITAIEGPATCEVYETSEVGDSFKTNASAIGGAAVFDFVT